MPAGVTVSVEPWDAPDGERLRRAQQAELDVRYGSDDHEPGERPSAASVALFVVARDREGTALGCGGLRVLGQGRAEIKRMYVVPEARGTGVATLVLRRIEEEATELGVTRLLLETGTRQPDAMRFYEREGYDRIEPFGPYVGAEWSVCYARTLA